MTMDRSELGPRIGHEADEWRERIERMKEHGRGAGQDSGGEYLREVERLERQLRDLVIRVEYAEDVDEDTWEDTSDEIEQDWEAWKERAEQMWARVG